MVLYVLRRLILLVPTLLGMSLIAFAVSRAIPSDPVVAAIGDQAAMHPEIVEQYRLKWGLDEPLPVQYLTYLNNLVHGDLGTSINTHRPVADDLRDYLPATVELATATIILSVLISFPLGIIAAKFRGTAFDFLIRMGTLVGVAMPIFWLAMVAIDIFYVRLGIAPEPSRLDATVPPPPTVTGLYTVDSLFAGDLHTFGNALSHLALPALVLSSWSIGLLTRVMRASMARVLQQDFLRTAKAKGARGFYLTTRHAVPNALVPVITVVGLSYGDLLSGAILIETLFSWPGIGRYAYNAAARADFPAIVGVALVVAVVYTLVNLLVDVAYAWIDPRIGRAMRAAGR